MSLSTLPLLDASLGEHRRGQDSPAFTAPDVSSSAAAQVRAFDESDGPAWDSFAQAHSFGTPFHTTAWKRTIEEIFGYRAYYLIATGENGIEGILPLFLAQNFLIGKALISSPFAVYGGALTTSDEAKAALASSVTELAHSLAVGHVELRNAWEQQCVGFQRVSRYVTFTQTVDPDEEKILSSIPRKTRAMVRKALKQGFSTRIQPADFAAFDEIYSANLRRLGTPSFPRSFFRALVRNFGSSVDIREVLLEDKVVAAVFNFYFRDQVLPYYGAADPEYNAAAPSNYMYFDLMHWAGQNGFRTFDFGRSKKESGSYAFKAHWGMEERDLPYEMLLVNRKTLPNYTPNNPRLQAAIKIWQKIPLPVTRMLGPMFLRLVP